MVKATMATSRLISGELRLQFSDTSQDRRPAVEGCEAGNVNQLPGRHITQGKADMVLGNPLVSSPIQYNTLLDCTQLGSRIVFDRIPIIFCGETVRRLISVIPTIFERQTPIVTMAGDRYGPRGIGRLFS